MTQILPNLALLPPHLITGLNAVIIHTAAPRQWWEYFFKPLSYTPKIPTDAERLERYQTAALLFGPKPGRAQDLRLQLGEQFKQAWARGQRPQLRRIYEQMPRRRPPSHLRVVK